MDESIFSESWIYPKQCSQLKLRGHTGSLAAYYLRAVGKTELMMSGKVMSGKSKFGVSIGEWQPDEGICTPPVSLRRASH